MNVLVRSAGFLTSVQDLGRTGFREAGVSLGGALDAYALRVANALVGNDENAAGFELTLGTLRLRFDDERLVAWCGGAFSVRIGDADLPAGHAGSVAKDTELIVMAPNRGGRAWLAISGGIEVPLLLASRSTDLRGNFGGHEGRALRDGDMLPLAKPSLIPAFSLGQRESSIPAFLVGRDSVEPTESRNNVHGSTESRPTKSAEKDLRFPQGERHAVGASTAAPWISEWGAPATWATIARDNAILRVVRGTDWDRFTPEARRAFGSSEFSVSSDSDRMGARLEGPELQRIEPGDLLSEAVAPGTIQVPPSGQPILLLGDCQTIGGYPKIAHVITVDLPIAAQLWPGNSVRFAEVSLEEAHRLLREREEDFARFRVGLSLHLE